jgi:hypothetical protein
MNNEPVQMYGGAEVWFHAFLTTALDTGKWSASCPTNLTPGPYWKGGSVGPRTGLDAMAKRKIPCPSQELTFSPVTKVTELSQLPRLLPRN